MPQATGAVLRRVVWLVALACAVASGCSNDSSTASGHTHKTLPAGDGTEASYVGYSLDGLRLPAKAGEPGQYTFRIGTFRGVPQTKYFTEQTRKMHVYVVRSDYSVFRHLHPTMSADGTWSGNLTLPEAGRYRLVTEFLAVDDGGNPDHLILGASRTVAQAKGIVAPEVPLPAPSDRVTVDDLTVKVHGSLRAGPDSANNRMRLGIGYRGEAADLGTYLGVYAHVTGFEASTGAMVHTHPLGAPTETGSESMLSFHTAFPTPGAYRLFVQVRVSGIVRTVPITVSVR